MSNQVQKGWFFLGVNVDDDIFVASEDTIYYTSRNKTLNQCRFNVGAASTTLDVKPALIQRLASAGTSMT